MLYPAYVNQFGQLSENCSIHIISPRRSSFPLHVYKKGYSVSEMIEHGFTKTHEYLTTAFVRQFTYIVLFSLKEHNSTEHKNLKLTVPHRLPTDFDGVEDGGFTLAQS